MAVHEKQNNHGYHTVLLFTRYCSIHNHTPSGWRMWATFLQATDVATIDTPLVTLDECVATLATSGRIALLSLLKTRGGVDKLGDRQRLAGALARARRSDAAHTAAEADDVDALRAALCVGTDINRLSGAGGVTPLMVASSNGAERCTALLLDAAAAVDVTRSMGLTALMIAAIKGHANCSCQLVGASAVVDRVDEDGWTALMYAALHGHADCVQALLEAGAEPRSAKRNGFSCLMAAAVAGDERSVALLLDARVDPSARSSRGWAAAGYAAAFWGVERAAVLGLNVDDSVVIAADASTSTSTLTCTSSPADADAPASFDDGEAGTTRGGRPFMVCFRPYPPGHTHDEAWRERPMSDAVAWWGSVEGEWARAAPRPSYYCASRFSHDLNILQVILLSHGVRRAAELTPAEGTASRSESAAADAQAASGPSLIWLSGQAVSTPMLRALRPHQRVNKFPHAIAALCDKAALWRCFARMQRRHGQHVYGFMPRTFVLPEQRAELELALGEAAGKAAGEAAGSVARRESAGSDATGSIGEVAAACASFTTLAPASEPAASLWIIKPASSQCGAGIRIHRTAEAQAFLALSSASSATERAVASTYIHPPYLVAQRKFDLRLYVLVTRWAAPGSPLTAYLHRSGIVRFATEPYTLDDLACQRAHLCNYAVNKGSERFVASTVLGHTEDGHVAEANGDTMTDCDATDGGEGSIWTLDAFRQHIASELGPIRAAALWHAVDDLVVKTLIAASPVMTSAAASDGADTRAWRAEGGEAQASGAECHQRLERCFQLFGFDVMLGADGTPWLLEVNGDPGLRTESPIFQRINAPMVADLLNLVGVRSPPPRHGCAPADDGSVADAGMGAVEAGEPAEKTGSGITDEIADEIADENYRYRKLQRGWHRLLPASDVEQAAHYEELLTDAARSTTT